MPMLGGVAHLMESVNRALSIRVIVVRVEEEFEALKCEYYGSIKCIEQVSYTSTIYVRLLDPFSYAT